MTGGTQVIEIIGVSSATYFSSAICIMMDSRVFGEFHFHYRLNVLPMCITNLDINHPNQRMLSQVLYHPQVMLFTPCSS